MSSIPLIGRSKCTFTLLPETWKKEGQRYVSMNVDAKYKINTKDVFRRQRTKTFTDARNANLREKKEDSGKILEITRVENEDIFVVKVERFIDSKADIRLANAIENVIQGRQSNVADDVDVCDVRGDTGDFVGESGKNLVVQSFEMGFLHGSKFFTTCGCTIMNARN